MDALLRGQHGHCSPHHDAHLLLQCSSPRACWRYVGQVRKSTPGQSRLHAAPAPLQIGHVFSTVLADTLARYQRIAGFEAVLSTGTDEHGMKVRSALALDASRMPRRCHRSAQVAQAAAERGMTPEQHVADTARSFQDTFAAFHVHPDRFVRTSSAEHTDVAQWLWRRLQDRGAIYLGQHEGWYCTSDETFVPEASTRVTSTGQRVVDSPTAPAVTWTSEPNYKFKLAQHIPAVQAWLQGGALSPPSRLPEVTGMLASLGAGSDLSVSRLASSVPWGIPVPSDPAHTMYVWLDALANYLTAAGYTTGSPVAAWPPYTQVLGKDITKFHAVYWPAFLAAAELPLPRHLLTHAHWTVEGVKMSKSLGNVVTPQQLLDAYPADQIRYFLLRDGGVVKDGAFSPDALHARAEAECANTLGNLASRVTSARLLPGQVVPACGPLSPQAQEAMYTVRGAAVQFEESMEEEDVSAALAAVMDAVSDVNRYFSAAEPWNLVPGKAREDAPALATVLYVTLETLRWAGIALQPAMPLAAAALLDRLGVPADQRSLEHSEPFGEWALLADAPLGPVPEGGFKLFPRAGQHLS